MEKVLWLAAWWLFVGCLIWTIFALKSFLSNPRFRDELDGDISNEVGYEVNS